MIKTKKHNNQIFDIVVYGNGLTAKSAVLYLSLSGFYVVWVADNKKTVIKDNRTTLLSLQSLEFLNNCNLLPNKLIKLHPTNLINIFSKNNSHFTSFSNDVLHKPLASLIKNISLKNELDKSLRNQIKSQKIIFFNSKILNAEFNDYYVTLNLLNKKSLKSFLVIAADGTDSILRKLSGIKTKIKKTNKNGIICKVKHSNEYPNVSWQSFSKEGILALLSMGGDNKIFGYSSLIWSLNEGLFEEKMKITDLEFETNLNFIFGSKLGKISLLDNRSSWPLKRIDVPIPFNNRCLVIGDAAHTIYPLAGQGFNLGIGDIIDLVDILRWSKNIGLDYGSQVVLEKYSIKRKSWVNSVTALTDGLDFIFNSRITSMESSGDLMIKALEKIEPLKSIMVKMMNEN